MAEQRARPLSPHLGIWRWGPHMPVSILHRVTGGALTVVGLAVLTWWLLALADGRRCLCRLHQARRRFRSA